MAIRVILFSFIFPFFTTGQISFFKTYGENGVDYGQGVVQLPDSSYAITGASSSFYDGPSQAFLLLVDSTGQYVWSRSYGGERTDWGRRIFHKPNEGFWIAGYSNSFSANADFDFYVVKTDESGEVEWEKTYGTSDWERLWDALLLPDGGMVLVGETVGELSLEEDQYIVRIASDGEEMWTRRLQTPGHDIAYACTMITDTSFVLVGSSSEINSAKSAYLAEIGVEGTVVWEQLYGIQGEGVFHSVSVFEDYIFTGGSLVLEGESQRNHWVAKLSNTGSYLSENIEVRPEDDYVSQIVVRDEHSVFATKWIEEDVFLNGPDLLLAKYHTEMYWNGYTGFFSSHEPDECHQLIVTLDGGVLLVGFAMGTTFSTGGSAITLIKISPNDQNPEGVEVNQTLVDIINHEFKDEFLSLYPNPVNDILYIDSSHEFNIVSYSLYNSSGTQLERGDFIEQLSFELYPKGIFFLTLTSENQSVVFRIVK
jgi:hypothetical protein